MDTVGDSWLPALPRASLPYSLYLSLHLYVSSSVIKGSQLLLSFPSSHVQLFMQADDACFNMWFFIYSFPSSKQFLISLLFIKDMEQVIN